MIRHSSVPMATELLSVQHSRHRKHGRSRHVDKGLPDNELTRRRAWGAGVVWDRYGHIVTNYHCIQKLASDRSGTQARRPSTSLLGLRCQPWSCDGNGGPVPSGR